MSDPGVYAVHLRSFNSKSSTQIQVKITYAISIQNHLRNFNSESPTPFQLKITYAVATQNHLRSFNSKSPTQFQVKKGSADWRSPLNIYTYILGVGNMSLQANCLPLERGVDFYIAQKTRSPPTPRPWLPPPGQLQKTHKNHIDF